MKNTIHTLLITVWTLAVFAGCQERNEDQKEKEESSAVLFQNVTIIDGNGDDPIEEINLLVQDGTITAIGENISNNNATTIDLEGKTIIPGLKSAHVHVGTLKDTTTVAENYTEDNIKRQLRKYADYGVLDVLSLGTDRPKLFETDLHEEVKKDSFQGARMYSAGPGFGVIGGAPPLDMAMDKVYRPTDSTQIPAQLDSLARFRPRIIKMWVDDFHGTVPKMEPAIYRTIIREAHKRDLKVAAHVYYLADAKQLVASGVDVIAHSIRDRNVDDAFIEEMKEKNIPYIPTLALDEFSYVYARQPEWIEDDFFRASLEPGVYEMITSEEYQEDLRNSPSYDRNRQAFETAQQNLKILHDSGVKIAMGTDSGASPVRAQGFSEHLELELMVEAGLSPLQALTVATKNASEVLKINHRYGTLEEGNVADFIVLDGNPETDIMNTRKIDAVYKAGEKISEGPIH